MEHSGLELHIDDEALSPNSSHCEVKISVVNFTSSSKLAEGFELASEVYKIDCQCQFVKPVILKIKHNADESYTSKLYIAISSDKHPPYTFYCVKEGEFDAYCGTIKRSSFSLIAMLKELIYGPSQYTISLYREVISMKPSNSFILCVAVTGSTSELESCTKEFFLLKNRIMTYNSLHHLKQSLIHLNL